MSSEESAVMKCQTSNIEAEVGGESQVVNQLEKICKRKVKWIEGASRGQQTRSRSQSDESRKSARGCQNLQKLEQEGVEHLSHQGSVDRLFVAGKTFIQS
jgi:hypothetical protein